MKRAPSPVWHPDAPERAELLADVAELLARSNREFKTSFAKGSEQDALRYPEESVRAAVHNVWLREGRKGLATYAGTSPGGVFWHGTHGAFERLEEGALASRADVREQLAAIAKTAKRKPAAEDVERTKRLERERERERLAQEAEARRAAIEAAKAEQTTNPTPSLEERRAARRRGPTRF